MDRDSILATLRAHQPELVQAGLLHLRLFGSVARGDHRQDSDVDLLFEYDESDTWNVLGAYSFEERVSQIIGVKAHLCAAALVRPNILDQARKEAVVVF